jgi:hypothetical protein
LVGGIGNQLFTYFAALNWALERGKNLEINVGNIGRNAIDHEVSLEEFAIEFPVVREVDGLIKSSYFRFVSFFARTRKSSWLRLLPHFGRFQSFTLGFDLHLSEQHKIREINGYFQTYRYYASINNDSFRELTLKNFSEWFVTMNSKIDGMEFVALHVRRGDYKNFVQQVGLLDKSYYLNALSRIDSTLQKKLPVFVFSDEIPLAREMLKELESRIFEWVQPPEGISAAESLILMSQAKAIVIANSTYSWWGARLGRKKTVVAPSDWFRSLQAPEDLYPTDWLLVTSSWENPNAL